MFLPSLFRTRQVISAVLVYLVFRLGYVAPHLSCFDMHFIFSELYFANIDKFFRLNIDLNLNVFALICQTLKRRQLFEYLTIATLVQDRNGGDNT